MLQVKLGELKLKNPLILASGILGISVSLFKRIERAGAGAITTKTITLKPRKGYPNPVFVDLGYGYLNAMGLPNPGIEEFIKELREGVDSVDIPIIISIGGSTVEEFVQIVEQIDEEVVDAIELNLSCPHARGYGIELGSDPKVVSKIVKNIVERTNLPVFVKLSATMPLKEIAKIAVENGVTGFTVTNTIKAMAIDVWAKKPILSNIYGGLSGPAIHPIAVRTVYELYEEYPDKPIIGVGGVSSWEDAIELILAGASAVGIGSIIASKDLKIFREILEGMRKYLLEEGFKNISEIIGLAHERT